MLYIWKYDLGDELTKTIVLPQGSQVLSVGEQDNRVRLWAAVAPGRPLEHRHFALVATGKQIPSTVKQFLGTVHVMGEVWHIFETSQ